MKFSPHKPNNSVERAPTSLDRTMHPLIHSLASLTVVGIVLLGCNTDTVQRSKPLIEAKELTARCVNDTFERVYASQENVSGILRVDVYDPSRYFVGGMDGGTSHPHHMFGRLGLDFIEFETSDEERVKHNARYGRLNQRTGQYSYTNEPTASLMVKFESVGSIEEERIGILGRKITVADTKTGKIYGEQQQWWSRRTGGCSDPRARWTGHMALLSKVINPVSYQCMSLPPTPQSGNFIDDGKRRGDAIEACETAYRAMRKARTGAN